MSIDLFLLVGAGRREELLRAQFADREHRRQDFKVF